MKTILNTPPKNVKLKVIEHPGFHYNEERMNSFMLKKAVVSDPTYSGRHGAFYGHVARFISNNVSRVACLSVFTEAEANVLVNLHNSKLER